MRMTILKTSSLAVILCILAIAVMWNHAPVKAACFGTKGCILYTMPCKDCGDDNFSCGMKYVDQQYFQTDILPGDDIQDPDWGMFEELCFRIFDCPIDPQTPCPDPESQDDYACDDIRAVLIWENYTPDDWVADPGCDD